MDTFIWGILGMLWRHIARLRAARNRILMERLLDSLPPDLRRDIGWPDRYLDSADTTEWGRPPAAPAIDGWWSEKDEPRAWRCRPVDPQIVPLPFPPRRRYAPLLPTRKARVSS
jgi:hypothetical protein